MSHDGSKDESAGLNRTERRKLDRPAPATKRSKASKRFRDKTREAAVKRHGPGTRAVRELPPVVVSPEAYRKLVDADV